METLLKTVDWTACSVKFQVALAALRDDVEKLFMLIPVAIVAKEISEANLREWPLFSTFREDSRFAGILESFGLK